MRRRLLLALSLILPSAIPHPAVAHDHRPPRATLLLEDGRQVGHAYHDQWLAQDPNEPEFCGASFGSGFPTFPSALEHRPGEPVVVRLHKDAVPMEIEAYRWRGVKKNGHAKGEPSPLPWVLRPHRVNGQVRAWEVVVGWPATSNHLYLGVAAYWADEEGCSGFLDLGSQYVAWTFHAKAP